MMVQFQSAGLAPIKRLRYGDFLRCSWGDSRPRNPTAPV